LQPWRFAGRRGVQRLLEEERAAIGARGFDARRYGRALAVRLEVELERLRFVRERFEQHAIGLVDDPQRRVLATGLERRLLRSQRQHAALQRQARLRGQVGGRRLDRRGGCGRRRRFGGERGRRFLLRARAQRNDAGAQK